jgi:hypothetical protein
MMRGTCYLLFFHQLPLKCWYLENRQHDATSHKIVTSHVIFSWTCTCCLFIMELVLTCYVFIMVFLLLCLVNNVFHIAIIITVITVTFYELQRA